MFTESAKAAAGTAGLAWLSAQGSPFDIGLALGRQGRRAVGDKLLQHSLWRRITGPGYTRQVERMLETTSERLPWVMDEIRGLAEGLALPVEDVFAWNCRGDLLASCPDGCTTVLLPGSEPCIAHNEDGLPLFEGDAFMASVTPRNQAAFMAFCYPGSIPGHTFALTEAGVVQAVNNLRFTEVSPHIPRMVLGRAMLAEPSVEAIIALLKQAPASGGFHFTLAQLGRPTLHSVEVGGGDVSCRTVDESAVHANHALHHGGQGDQLVTRSSGDRQQRGVELLAAGERDPLVILRDTGGSGLPIFRREPDDPDDENTLVTGVFRLLSDKVDWEIHTPRERTPLHGTSRSVFA